jgi:hypothetical protein
MCFFSTPKPSAAAAPVLPPEPAQAQTPDYQGAQDAQARRTQDRIRSGSNTILTTPQGVTSSAATKAPALSGTAASNTVLTGAAGDASAPKKIILGQ